MMVLHLKVNNHEYYFHAMYCVQEELVKCLREKDEAVLVIEESREEIKMLKKSLTELEEEGSLGKGVLCCVISRC